MKTFYVVLPSYKINEHLEKGEVSNTAFNLKSNYFSDEDKAISMATYKTKLHRSAHIVMKSHILIEPIPTDIDIKQTKL